MWSEENSLPEHDIVVGCRIEVFVIGIQNSHHRHMEEKVVPHLHCPVIRRTIMFLEDVAEFVVRVRFLSIAGHVEYLTPF